MKLSFLSISVPVAGLAMITSAHVAPSAPAADTTSITIRSTVPVHPVRVTILGTTSDALIVADSLRTVGDTVVAVTPIQLRMGPGVARILIDAAAGDPWLAVSGSLPDGRLIEAWGQHVEVSRRVANEPLDLRGAALRVSAR